MHKHRLGLVVGIVSYRDLASCCFICYTCQECISHASSSLFKGQPVFTGQCRYVLAIDCGGETPIVRKRSYILRVGVSLFSTYAMVYMRHMEPEVVSVAQTQQNMQQANRIGPARDAHNYSIARCQ